MNGTYAEGATCRPNFSAAWRRRRTRVATAGAVTAVIALVGFVAIDASWWLRLLVAIPAGVAAVSGLQVRRNTFVAHAATGRFENDDLTTTRVDEAFAAASREVAATIWRDGILLSLTAGALAAATAWVT